MPTYSENIVPQMTATNAPSPYVISASSQYDTTTYPAWKVFDKGNSVWLTPANTTTGWLSIDLNVAKILGRYSLSFGTDNSIITAMPKNWTFEGSNNGTVWQVLDTRANEPSWTVSTKRLYTFSNDNKYRYYRINISANQGSTSFLTIVEMELMEVSLTNKFLISSSDEKSYSMQVADTTKNVARESGVIVTASNTAGGSPSALIDGAIIPNSWYASPNKNVWVAIEFPSSKEIFRYTMATAAGGYGVMPSPKDWALQGSNDDFATFDTLDTRTEIRDWVDSVKKVFDVPKDKVRAYKKYRIYVFQSGHAVEVTHINEIEMYEDYVKIIDLGNKTLNETDYMSKGLNKGFVVDVNREITKRVGIESTSSTLGSGKVFKKTVDTTGIPIKNVSIT